MAELDAARNVKQTWDRFIGGFHAHGADDEAKRRITLLVSLSGVGIVNLALFGTIAFFQGNLSLGTADFTAFAVLLLNLHDARRRKRTSFNILFGAVFVGIFFTFLFVSGGEKNTAFVWCYAYPLIACFLLGARVGGIAASLLLIPVLLHILFDPGPPFAVYPIDFKARFFFSYIVVGWFSFLSEYTRESNREELGRTQAALETTICELNAAKEALKVSMEGTLRASEERYRALFSRAGDGIFIMSLDGKLVEVNESFARMHGYGTGELLRMNIMDLDTPETTQRMAERVARLMAGETLSFEVEHHHKDGHVFPLEVSTSLISFGGKSYIQSFHRDITRRRQAEDTLRESEERLRAISENAPVAIFLKDTAGRYIHVNRLFEKEFDVDNATIQGKTDQDIFPKEFVDAFIRNDQLVIRTGQPITVEEPAPHSDGTHIYLVVKFPLRSGAGEIYAVCGMATDITEQKNAEEEKRRFEEKVLQTQKLESLGVLAGGIAHDFNNLLMVILGNAEMVQKRISDMPAVRRNLAEIVTAGTRAAELCRQMLAYAGKVPFSFEPVPLEYLVEEMVRLLNAAISKKAILNLNLERSLPPILGDPSQIRQVVMNLILNASEAIGDRSGIITVSIGRTTCDEKSLRDAEMSDIPDPGPYVYLEVTDTGCGMDAETRSRIFEPFFSTKFAGRGLGLAAVLGIVRSHKGVLKVHSVPGEGTTFRILFPAVGNGEKGASSEETLPPADSSWGQRTILLADDEESLLALGASMLEDLGFTVLTAADGLQAVELYRERRKEIDLVLMDLTMPHMDGAEAFDELRRLDPEVRIILASGYSKEDVASRFAGKGLNGVLQKPYTFSRLRESLAGLAPKRTDAEE